MHLLSLTSWPNSTSSAPSSSRNSLSRMSASLPRSRFRFGLPCAFLAGIAVGRSVPSTFIGLFYSTSVYFHYIQRILIQYIRYTVMSKVSHLHRTLPPNTASQHFSRLHTDLLNNHLNICPQSVPHETALTFKLSSPHLDVRKLASLPLALGGHGFLPFSHERPLPHSDSPTNQADPTLTYHHASFYASWACTWSRIRAWVPPLRDESFPPVTNVTPNSPPLPPFQAQVIDTWLAINLASARLQSHPHRARLPSHYSIPINPRSRKSGPGLFLECRSALDSGRDFFGDVET